MAALAPLDLFRRGVVVESFGGVIIVDACLVRGGCVRQVASEK